MDFAHDHNSCTLYVPNWKNPDASGSSSWPRCTCGGLAQSHNKLPASPKWVRTCTECGNRQDDKKPEGDMTDAYRNRTCKRCKSPGLNYGVIEHGED